MPSQATKKIHKHLQNLLSIWAGIPTVSQHDDYANLLREHIASARQAAIDSEQMDKDKSLSRCD